MQVHCPGREAQDVTVVDHVKLIRNLPELEFEFRIHEQVLPSIRRAGGDVGWTEIYVVHSGAEHTPEVHAKKLARDFRLLELELADRPEHPFTLFNLGMTHADAGDHAQAINYLQCCLEVSPPQDSHVRKAYALLLGSLMQARRFEEAWTASEQGLQLFPDDKELLFRRAMLLHQFGRLHAAKQTYLRILNEPVERQFSSVDVGITDYKARHNLAVVYEDLGQLDEAEMQWQMILDQHPDYAPAREGRKRLARKCAPHSESPAPPSEHAASFPEHEASASAFNLPASASAVEFTPLEML
ncbi:tetratricopeptide repeat protein [Planctomicrobium sp. SH664]|uniref:tetratricopeptide repeat protein n=1 Tax=Planctomicrobium sp. SH664 TaxID=3448125 RepID=UPI003F5BEAEF